MILQQIAIAFARNPHPSPLPEGEGNMGLIQFHARLFIGNGITNVLSIHRKPVIASHLQVAWQSRIVRFDPFCFIPLAMAEGPVVARMPGRTLLMQQSIVVFVRRDTNR